MHSDTLTLVASLLAPIAFGAAAVALVSLLLSVRMRRVLAGTTARLGSHEVTVRAGLAEVRRSAEEVTGKLARLRADGNRLALDVERLTAATGDARRELDRVTRQRVRPLATTMRVAGALARVALLWRAPAR